MGKKVLTLISLVPAFEFNFSSVFEFEKTGGNVLNVALILDLMPELLTYERSDWPVKQNLIRPDCSAWLNWIHFLGLMFVKPKT